MIERADLSSLWLLGKPVKHSLSPCIQNAALAQMNRRVLYIASEVAENDFQDVVRALPKLGAIGANVTVPHKQRAFSLCHELSESARAMRAVNTLIFRDGEILGDNTDGEGWWQSLLADWEQLSRRIPSQALILGAGGAARAIAHTLVQQGVTRLTILNRSLENAESLCEELREVHGSSFECELAAPVEFSKHLQPDQLVVQCTSVGLKSQESPVPLPQTWPEGSYFSELIYGETTSLLSRVQSLGGQASDGLGMLCYQAARSLSLWFSCDIEEVPSEHMMARARIALRSRSL